MSLTDLTDVPAGINHDVKNAKQQTMLALLGSPRFSYDVDCQEVTNATLKNMLVTQNVGPFRVTGLQPAIEDLCTIFAEVQATDEELSQALGTAGMLCARLVRGTTTGAISNHSWGTAIDIRIDDQLDRRGDGKVFVGLVQLAPFFHRHGWFWGAGFGTEDGMHFEVGDEKIRQWHAAGLLGDRVMAPMPALSIGDRGPEVRELQERLNTFGNHLTTDGVFGMATRAAVVAFQAEKGLTPDGIVGPKTRAALGM